MQYAQTDTILKVENVNVTLGGKKILSDINFEIKDIVRPNMTQGQVTCILGRSGIGKSTLFDTLAGLYSLDPPNSGEIRVGKDLTDVKIGDMGVVFQDYYLYPHRRLQKIFLLSVEKNPLVAVTDRQNLVAQVAEEFELTQHIKKFPGELSGGQKQRAAIAEQILNGGNFLLLDEPFSGLDVIMIKKVVDLLIKVSLTDELKTLFIVSHDLPNSVAISDTVLLLNYKDGKPENGATIIEHIDLIERDLAWHKDIKQTEPFKKTIKEIESKL
jgi:ABC-type nitrate/sulfonate/bicarbonate transport system ATPase subunit